MLCGQPFDGGERLIGWLDAKFQFRKDLRDQLSGPFIPAEK
jgi:hypothetical protein